MCAPYLNKNIDFNLTKMKRINTINITTTNLFSGRKTFSSELQKNKDKSKNKIYIYSLDTHTKRNRTYVCTKQ